MFFFFNTIPLTVRAPAARATGTTVSTTPVFVLPEEAPGVTSSDLPMSPAAKAAVEDEQALVMKIQSEESARSALFEELGLGEIKAKQLIEAAPDERKSKLTLLYDELTGYVARIKQLNNIIVETVEKKLSVQEELMRKTGMTLTETYNGYGAKIKHTSAPKGFLGNI